jgi:glycosyltransferase 2 family protein
MPSRSRRLLRFGVLTVVTAGFLLLFQRQADLRSVLPALAELPAWSLFASLGALLANLAFVVLRWRVLLAAAGVRVAPSKLFVTVSVGTGVNNVLPARAGDLVRIESVRSGEGVPVFVLAATLFAERLLDGLVLAVWLLVGALVLGVGGPLLLTGIALSSGSALGVILAALAAARPEGLERLVSRLPRRVSGGATDFLAGLASFRNHRALAVALSASICVWLANLVLYVAVGGGLGIEAGLGGYLALEGVGNLALAVPGTAAGIGSFDYLTLMTARSLAVPEAAAVAYVLAVHALTVVPVTLLGLLLLSRALPARRPVPAVEPA